jgi:hypothetical protein
MGIRFPHVDVPFDTAVPWWQVVSLRNRFYLKNFVETGTGYGDTSLAATHLFQKVWTVEIVPGVFNQQRTELQQAAQQGKVIRENGNTVDVLRRWMPDLDAAGPSLFYLDAHWPGMGDKIGTECPLLEELEVICRREAFRRDVVMIDNAGLFINTPPPPHDPEQWPTEEAIRECVKLNAPEGTCFAVYFDTFIISPNPLIQ